MACILQLKQPNLRICSIQVKPNLGVANQGGTIMFGGGRAVFHIEEVQESQSSTNGVNVVE